MNSSLNFRRLGICGESPPPGTLVPRIKASVKPGLPQIPPWTRTTLLVPEHAALQTAPGCEGGCPFEWACYRFAAKVRSYKRLLDSCIVAMSPGAVRQIRHGKEPRHRRVGPSAYANGQRFVSKTGASGS
jgi:hypothetical protein